MNSTPQFTASLLSMLNLQYKYFEIKTHEIAITRMQKIKARILIRTSTYNHHVFFVFFHILYLPNAYYEAKFTDIYNHHLITIPASTYHRLWTSLGNMILLYISNQYIPPLNCMHITTYKMAKHNLSHILSTHQLTLPVSHTICQKILMMKIFCQLQ